MAGRIEEMTETGQGTVGGDRYSCCPIRRLYGCADVGSAGLLCGAGNDFPPGTSAPDDTLLTTGGRREETGGQISFAEEAAQGEHISAREKDFTEDGGYVVRHYVPVIRDGETVAMISGVVELAICPTPSGWSPMKARQPLSDRGGNRRFSDGYLAWRDGGISGLWGERKMAPGYDHETLKEGLTEGGDSLCGV